MVMVIAMVLFVMAVMMVLCLFCIGAVLGNLALFVMDNMVLNRFCHWQSPSVNFMPIISIDNNFDRQEHTGAVVAFLGRP